MHHLLSAIVLAAIAIFVALRLGVWLFRRLTAPPPKQELAPPPTPPDPLCQEVEGLIRKLDGDMNALAASGSPVPQLNDPRPAPGDMEPDPAKPPKRQL